MGDSNDAAAPALVGVLAGAACVGLFFWRSRVQSQHKRMEDATRRRVSHTQLEHGTQEYFALRGEVSSSASFVADFSEARSVASKTQLRHKWAERSVSIERRPGERDLAVYGEWEQKSELVGEPVLKAVPFVLVVQEQSKQVGNIALAVGVEAGLSEIPLLLRFSQSLEEGKKSSVNVVNNNGSGGVVGQLSGGRELRELGTLREEYVLPVGTALTIFGMVRRSNDGSLVVSAQGCDSERPFIATLQTVEQEMADKRSTAQMLLIAACLCGVVAVGSAAIATYRAIRN